MSSAALALVLGAAVIHAYWNLLQKRVGGGAPLAWLTAALATAIYLPAVVAWCLWKRPEITVLGWVFLVGTGLIHVVYYLVLQRGYREADLSLVYPIARGSGPMFSVAGAVLFFGERPSAMAWVGIGLVLTAVGIISLGGAALRADPARVARGRQWGLATGACIAAYTLWDKHAMAVIGLPPLLHDYASAVVTTVVLLPAGIRGRVEWQGTWRVHRWKIAGIAFFRALSFIMILSALAFTPVSAVAPAREISILLGVAFGSRLLAEGDTARRLGASAMMLAGLSLIALG